MTFCADPHVDRTVNRLRRNSLQAIPPVAPEQSLRHFHDVVEELMVRSLSHENLTGAYPEVALRHGYPSRDRLYRRQDSVKELEAKALHLHPEIEGRIQVASADILQKLEAEFEKWAAEDRQTLGARRTENEKNDFEIGLESVLTVFKEADWRDLIPEIFQGHRSQGVLNVHEPPERSEVANFREKMQKLHSRVALRDIDKSLRPPRQPYRTGPEPGFEPANGKCRNYL
ncbi:unnamed protein product [Cyprideis torosa]|uniref:Uncharacterized protein n=1 Tax=Cyprideis torosa TaxID=163714 RepID=A0A7R8ZNQ8_9CRUS|nr:unnamed protein product [Cyprideis torosa]CAG0896915.1 unnamed protein product [Cyprideis torosa]